MLEPQQIIDSLESISRNVMLTEEQRMAASAAAHSLAEACKDSARLDWYERNSRFISASTGYLGAGSGWCWRDQTAEMTTHSTDTLRAAIDAAMEGK
jgi:hypothetical protein